MLFKKLYNLLEICKSDLVAILIYGSVVGLFYLIIPISAQGLVTIVSFGSITQPIFVLIISLFVLLSAAAICSIFQKVLVENIQQRIFVQIALKLAYKLPNISIHAFEKQRGTELINRFFDVMTIQKTSAIILLSGTAVFLQAALGLILLAFYHPLLLAFDIGFIIILLLVVWLPWQAGLKSALEESEAKYSVAAWLEEIVRVPSFFRFMNYQKFASYTADKKVAQYLRARQKHFSRLMIHIYGTYLLQVLASTVLFLLGSILVIKEQLTLGQLVASEIVVTSLGLNVAKLGKYLENIYDLLASTEKVSYLLDLPIEDREDIKSLTKLSAPAFQGAPFIKIDKLVVKHHRDKSTQPISLTISENTDIVIEGPKGSGKSIFIETLLGFRAPMQGNIYYNNIPIQEYQPHVLRSKVSYLKGIEFFDGSIIDNLTMGNKDITMEEIRQVISRFQLDDVISTLPDGVHSQLYGSHHQLSSVELQKLTFIRAVLARPYLLVIDEALDMMSLNDLDLILKVLMDNMYPWSLIVTTRRKEISAYFKVKVSL